MTRKECLDAAAECVLKDRASQYGGMEDNFARIAELWNAYLGPHAGIGIESHDVAAMMALLKIARVRSNPGHGDSWIDLAGYAACGAECAGGKPVSAPKAESGCCQNENNQPEEPEFKPGDKVQVYFPSIAEWRDATYVSFCQMARNLWRHEVEFSDGGRRYPLREHVRPAPKAEGCEEPEFKRDDKVEVQMAPDSSTWASATIMAVYRDKDTCEWRYCVDFEDGWAHVTVPSARVRPVSAPKAEGCEELVQRIKDVNPAIYGGGTEEA